MSQGVIASSISRVIVGLGATGLSCARFLHANDLNFSVIDTRVDPPGLEAMREEMPEVAVYAGVYPVELLTSATELIVSPGVSLEEPAVAQALQAGVRVIGDVDLFVANAQAPVVGITGSNAKSTVTELVGRMASHDQLNVGVGGNLGTPALELLAPDRALYVLELSSFQLERAGRLGLEVATVLNVSPDHLDRHGSMVKYHQAKHRIFQGCSKVVLNRDDPLTVPLVPPDVDVISWRMAEPELGGFGLRKTDAGETIFFGFDAILPVVELGMVGRHNVANALAALAIGHAAGLSLASMQAALREFKGLAHRCEAVAEIGKVRYVNDSKGTNVGATLAAITGLADGRNIVLIAGGLAKGADFNALKAAVAKHCKAALVIGEAAASLNEVLGSETSVTVMQSMQEAVAEASAIAAAGDIVLLSPACASFDMFDSYIQRGEVFRHAVQQLAGGDT
ncbi:MAG: UDP-N-acetylmuramoyl-L-alanine--D-glutamate ligase [Pseudomonadota bacterium]